MLLWSYIREKHCGRNRISHGRACGMGLTLMILCSTEITHYHLWYLEYKLIRVNFIPHGCPWWIKAKPYGYCIFSMILHEASSMETTTPKGEWFPCWVAEWSIMENMQQQMWFSGLGFSRPKPVFPVQNGINWDKPVFPSFSRPKLGKTVQNWEKLITQILWTQIFVIILLIQLVLTFPHNTNHVQNCDLIFKHQ